MRSDHEAVKREARREENEGFPPCRCEKCEPEEARILIQNLALLTSMNFDEGLQNPRSLNPKADYSTEGMEVYEKDDDNQRSIRKRKSDHPTQFLDDPDLSDLMFELSEVFLDHFNYIYEGDAPFQPNVLFNQRHLNRIIEKLESIKTEDCLRKSIGGEPLIGTVKLLFRTISDWKTDSRGEMHYKRVREQARLSDENRKLTLARLEKQQAERVEKHLIEVREEKERALQKTAKEKEVRARSEVRLKKRIAVAERNSKKLEEKRNNQSEKAKNLRMMQ